MVASVRLKKNLMNNLIAVVLSVSVFWAPTLAYGQDSEPEPTEAGEFRLVVPLLEGNPAPFSGILMPEADFRLAIEQDAAADRWQQEARVFERQLETERVLFEAFITEQRNRINELSEVSWWDENGALLMFGLGTALGVVVSAIIVGLATN